MERSEPALAPEWLKCAGNIVGGSPSSHQLSPSSPHSDVSSTWSRDSHRPAFLERNYSSNSRRSSGCNGSAKHPYSSFNRSHRERIREKDKVRSLSGDIWDRDPSDPLDNILTLGVEKSSLRRSQSLVSRRTGEVATRKPEELRNGVNTQHSANETILGGSNLSGVQRAAFDKDFPSLGNEDKLGGSVIGRVSSPVLSTAVQSLPIISPGLLGGEKWTSALAEVPPIIGNNSICSSSAQQSAFASPTSGTSSTGTNLNMAEALSQVPSRARASPQVPDKTLRMEELAIKQSRQLIPMTPSMPKTLVSSPSEKSKQPKAVVRLNELTVPARNLQQQVNYSSQVSNLSRGGQVRSDASNASHSGKFLVLKAAKENVICPTAVSSPTYNSNGKVVNSPLPQASLTPIALTSTIVPKGATLEKRAAASSLNPKSTSEKKSSFSQAQSRSDFFNLMRKKTLVNTSTVSNSSTTISSCANKLDESTKESESRPASPYVMENGNQMISIGDGYGADDAAQSFIDDGDKNLCINGAVYPDEEEAAFLRSLGWEENGEDAEITDEEINAFYVEYQKLMPTLKLGRDIQPKCSMLSEFHSPNSVVASSESGSVGSKSEA